MITGACNCGRSLYASHAAPRIMLICQCRDCQRDSGTGHSCHVMLPEGAFELSGPTSSYRSRADSGRDVARAFCSICGSSLTYRSEAFPRSVFVTAGTLDDPTLFVPQMVVYASSAQPWDSLDPRLERFDQMPPLKL